MMFDFGVSLSIENYNAVRGDRDRASQRGRRVRELREIEAQERATAKAIAHDRAACSETSPAAQPLGRNAGQPT